MIRTSWSFLLLTVLPVAAGAQSIRGKVLEASGAPVPGVVVFMLDQRDSIVARSLSNESGDYRVAASAAGAYRLRATRIGFRPTVSAAVMLSVGQDAVQQLTLTGLPVALDTVRVAQRGSCETPRDSAVATFALWEQVRAALTATQLTAGTRGIDATLATYERSLEPDRERVTSHRSSITSGLIRTLWTSPSADSLRRSGYIVENPVDGSTTYWAPDLRVLLSDQFVEDHCFRLVGATDSTRIGIEFEPSRERRGKPGIRGTLFVDRKTAELRRMEFRYVNATREQQYGNAGGTMDFARAKNGAWLISGWHIRMPVLVLRDTRMSGVSGSRATTRELRVESLRLEGGEVAMLARAGDTLWTRPPFPMMGEVLDSLSGARIAGASVSLRGTTMSARSGSAGRFRLLDVLPGQYWLEVRTPALAALGYTHATPVTFADSATRFTVKLPSAAQVVESVCPLREAGAAAQQRDGMIAGTARLAGDTSTLRNLRVVAQWNETTATGARWGSMEAYTDYRSAFRMCGLPLGTRVSVGVWADSTTRGLPPALDVRTVEGRTLPSTGTPTSVPRGGVGDVYRISGGRTIALVSPVEVNLARTARYATVELVLDPVAQRGATVMGVVLTDVNGQPLADVEVAIKDAARNAYTNEAGAFRIEDVPPGSQTITARKVGYALLTSPVELAPNAVVERTLMLKRVNTLDTVVTTARADLEFEENRRLGLGRFLTRVDIDKLGGGPIGSALEQLQGAGLARGRGNAAWLLSSRATQGTSIDPYSRNPNTWCPDGGVSTSQGQKCGCYSSVYFDGVLMNPPEPQFLGGRVIRPTPPFDVNSIPSASMEAIEWYTGMSQLPARYQSHNTECGVLVIHKRKEKKETGPSKDGPAKPPEHG